MQDSKIAILDQSHDNTTREITSKLISLQDILYLGEELLPGDDVEDVFQERGKSKWLSPSEQISNKTLERNGKVDVQLLADASDPNTARMLTNYASPESLTTMSKKEKLQNLQLASIRSDTEVQNALQRRIEECLHVCSGYHGYDFDAHFGHDDFNLD